MKIAMIDLDAPEIRSEWENYRRGQSYVYSYDAIDLYYNGTIGGFKNFDLYVFKWDDGKGKHESYEVTVKIPVLDDMTLCFYGEDEKEAMGQFKEWLTDMGDFSFMSIHEQIGNDFGWE